eukprot:TRINITY_DN31619_c0_g1_i1.p1 TRINITY_DN31619_c0_g1~~TRINITY_DN31619_c0_g1_i1.p1  ORF type:complete len:105 (-),score=3.69 TRINITY_DN31619_c0_g1_i1:12-326(-)
MMVFRACNNRCFYYINSFSLVCFCFRGFFAVTSFRLTSEKLSCVILDFQPPFIPIYQLALLERVSEDSLNRLEKLNSTTIEFNSWPGYELCMNKLGLFFSRTLR